MKNLLTLIFVLSAGALAHAHAFLDHAEPRVGSTVDQPPAHVKLWMTEGLEQAFCRVQVYGAGGVEIDKKDTIVNGATMTVSLPRLAPGVYKVAWKAVATDTHKTTGTFSFTVR